MEHLQELKEQVFRANLDLVKHGLVLFTWGNVSAIDPLSKLVVIKPSGVSYDVMKADDMVVVDLNGKVVEGKYRPSSDTPTHIEIYKAFGAGGVVHTHSTYATAWAQACCKLPNIGTTQADYFCTDIPCTREMTVDEINGAYERETGNVIVEAFANLNPANTPAVLVRNHGPFTWGVSADEAVHNAVVLEEVAHTAYLSFAINPNLCMSRHLVYKHFFRKHGAGAYYGQTANKQP